MILDFEKLMYPQPLKGRKRQPYDTSVYDLKGMRKAYRDTFSPEHGKIVLADIAQRGLLHTVSFTGETPLSTAFNEGKRALALEIIHLLNPNSIHNRTGDPDDRTTQFEFD